MCQKWIDVDVEVGEGLAFNIVEEVDGFWIGYCPEEFKGWRPPRSDLKWVINDIRRALEELNIQRPPYFALELVLYGGLGTRSNPTCLVDKRREVVYLRLPIDVIDGQLGLVEGLEIADDYLFYHELMHVKDVLEGRFPSMGFIIPSENPKLALISSLWHFSIEGRLEKRGKPHKSRQQVIEDEHYFGAMELERSRMVEAERERWKRLITKEFFEDLCDELWGKEVTFQELRSLLKEGPEL